MTNTAIKTATVLAFERKLANSDAIMHAGNWEQRGQSQQWPAIAIKGKDVRGTISNRQKNAIQSDPALLDAEVQKPNLQHVDVAALPFNADTLKLSFTLRVLDNLDHPSACNDPNYQEALAAIIRGYADEHSFKELAHRYATNLASGRFLWRNRVGTEAVEVRIKQRENQAVTQQWIFSSEAFGLRDFDTSTDELQQLATVIQQGLQGETFALLEVEAFACLGTGQEVFPSQELVLDPGRDSKKSKTLYQVDGVAAMHSQKIGNALRTIDTWYPQAGELGPIAIEPFGAVTNRGKAYRQPKDKLDFYTLLDGWILKGNVPPAEQQHYVMAILIRGGVFGGKD